MENRLEKTFNELNNRLEYLLLLGKDDKLDTNLKDLKEVIEEVSKRLIIINTSTEEVVSNLGKYQDAVDSNNPFTMSVNDYDSILRLNSDINILTDLDDDEPIVNNWDNMFLFKPIDELLTDFYKELSKKYFYFQYNRSMGTCHVGGNQLIEYDCTPFWEDAKGISVVQKVECEEYTNYIIPCDIPTTYKEFLKFKEFYEFQVKVMINSIQTT